MTSEPPQSQGWSPRDTKPSSREGSSQHGLDPHPELLPRLGSCRDSLAKDSSLKELGLSRSPRPLTFRTGKARGRDRTLREHTGQQAFRRGLEEGQAGEVLLILSGPVHWPVSLPNRRGLSGNGGIPWSQARVSMPMTLGRRGGSLE